jgi:hypothetical protein
MNDFVEEFFNKRLHVYKKSTTIIDMESEMKLLIILNNSEDVLLTYRHTGYMKPVKRRAVEIELTKEQIKEININQLGTDGGMAITETIETISEIIGE